MGIVIPDLDRPVGRLSGGQRQVIAIARAIYFGARVIILDEPTAALGVKQSGVVLKYIVKARDAGLGVIFITHNPHHAYLVGNHFIILKLGRVVLDAHRDELTLEQLTGEMAGGQELDELSHELAGVDPGKVVPRSGGRPRGGPAHHRGSGTRRSSSRRSARRSCRPTASVAPVTGGRTGEPQRTLRLLGLSRGVATSRMSGQVTGGSVTRVVRQAARTRAYAAKPTIDAGCPGWTRTASPVAAPSCRGECR